MTSVFADLVSKGPFASPPSAAPINATIPSTTETTIFRINRLLGHAGSNTLPDTNRKRTVFGDATDSQRLRALPPNRTPSIMAKRSSKSTVKTCGPRRCGRIRAVQPMRQAGRSYTVAQRLTLSWPGQDRVGRLPHRDHGEVDAIAPRAPEQFDAAEPI